MDERTNGNLTFMVAGEPHDDVQQWFISGLLSKMTEHNHVQLNGSSKQEARLVLNLTTEERPRPYRRQSQSVFVGSVVVAKKPPENLLQATYPLLVKTLANLVIYLVPQGERVDAYFVTLDQGHPCVSNGGLDDEAFFNKVYERLKPMATSTLVIDNIYVPDLPRELWEGNEVTEQMYRAGKILESLKLLPSVVPIENLLSERDLRHVWRLFRIGGLSYGNVSARHDATSFWMSASGVDKSNLRVVGEHIHLVKGYDPEKNAIIVSIPETKQERPTRVSVDAIEHYIIYRENPEVGAVVHAHCWLDQNAPLSPDYTIKVTEEAYPCGTRELAQATASVVSQAPDPTRTIIGQKNHGLVITGRNLPDIFDRIQSGDIPIVRQIPMM